MAIPQIEASVKDLVQYIFIDNKHDNKVLMNLPQGESGIRNNHDLFVFFVDLLCKGLVMLYGNADNKVPLETLTTEQLGYVTHKLRNAAIDLKVTTREVVSPDGNPVLMKPCIYKGDTEELNSYSLRLVTQNIEYNIQFELLRI